MEEFLELAKNKFKYMQIRNFVLYKLKNEAVLCISAILAICSAFIIPPSIQYISYVDWKVLVILFAMMGIMNGLKRIGVFEILATFLLNKTKTERQIVFTFVFLNFFTSMIITNDVALLAFVPFSIYTFDSIGKTKSVMKMVVLETIAANLGSMLTPIGNPQNLYLYNLSKISLLSFMLQMLPYACLSAILLFLCILFMKENQLAKNGLLHLMDEKQKKNQNKEILKRKDIDTNSSIEINRTRAITYLFLFLLCLLTVAHLLYYPILLLIVVGVLWINDKEAILEVDYSLLFTFFFFFIFVGNLTRMEFLEKTLTRGIYGKETFYAILFSQLISNVPAAFLLSGFTKNIKDIIIGVNIGGLGTLIASMASLISYKYYVKRFEDEKKTYIKYFSFYNIIFLVILFALFLVIDKNAII